LDKPLTILNPKYLIDHEAALRAEAKQIKVIYTDLDNTLLGPGASLFLGPDQQYSLEPARALVALMRAGIDLVPVSGRNNAQLREVCRLIGLQNYIAELGCLLFYGQGREVFVNHDFPIPPNRTLHQAITDTGAPALLLDRFRGRLEYHTPWSNQQECTHLFRGFIDANQANNLLAGEGFYDLRIVDNGRCRAVGTLGALPEIHAYHLLPKDASKASAIRADQRERGFARQETIALGDSRADLEMADAVGSFFLVSDNFSAEPELAREIARCENAYVTSRKMGLGWAEVASLLV
jgi:predicted mannosyl-3-phosphoglycerate phosphatase (HAD superfamily)